MAVYKCSICGYVFDEAKEGKKISEIDACPVCLQDVSMFEIVEEDTTEEKKTVAPANKSRYMNEIHEMASTGRSISGAMGTQMKMPSFDTYNNRQERKTAHDSGVPCVYLAYVFRCSVA